VAMSELSLAKDLGIKGIKIAILKYYVKESLR
jgi:hypothetical protein